MPNSSNSNSLRWIMDLLNLMSSEAISIPPDYRNQVLQTKALLKNDTSGLVNSVLDFAIGAALVDYSLEANDETLSTLLEDWAENINSELRGRIPTGVDALAKEYFRERWKGSSHLVLMVRWGNVDGWQLPVNMWFLDGEDVLVKDPIKKGMKVLGDEQYHLLINPETEESVRIATRSDESFFVQKPYEAWGEFKPTPYLIRRGIFRNMKFFDLIASKSEQVVRRAVEYMMLMKKGSEKLASMNQVVYSPEDLKAASDDFARFVAERRHTPSDRTPSYTTQFDTDIEHLIPEYERAVKQELYMAIERRILGGLGLVDIVESTTSTRREGILNPKPLKQEVNDGVRDFKMLLKDVMAEVSNRNRGRHPRKTNIKIVIRSTPVTAFLGDKEKQLLRTMYDRGILSKQTYAEVVGEMPFEIEVQRRKAEREDKLEKTMYPPVTQNQEQHQDDVNGKPIADDRTGPEAKNFDQATEKLTCELCQEGFNASVEDADTVECPSCEEELIVDAAKHMALPKKKKKKKRRKTRDVPSPYRGDLEPVEEAEVIYEQAPFKRNSDLPKGVKVLPSAARTIWRKTFNSVESDTGDELRAIRIAWSAVKKVYKKVGKKWVRRENASTGDLVQATKLEILDKQEQVMDKLLGEAADATTE